MKKPGLVFLLAVGLPAAVLGFLALRAAREQREILLRQETALRQREADDFAAAVRDSVREAQQEFVRTVRLELAASTPAQFAETLAARGPEGFDSGIPFAVTLSGELLAPQAVPDFEPAKGDVQAAARQAEFLQKTAPFLQNVQPSRVYNDVAQARTDAGPAVAQRQQFESADASLGRTVTAPLSAAAQSPIPAARPGATRKEGELRGTASLLSDSAVDSRPRNLTRDRREERAPPPASAASIEDVSEPLEAAQSEAATPATPKAHSDLDESSYADAEGGATAPQADARRSLAQRRVSLGFEATEVRRENKDLPAPVEPAPDSTLGESGLASLRVVVPRRQVVPSQSALASTVVGADSRFRELAASAADGIAARFVDDSIEVLFWYRAPEDPSLVFGRRLSPPDLRPVVEQALSAYSSRASPGTVAALLDERGRPFLSADPAFEADWRRPFVSAEIGEVLPRWEAALYLADPAAFESAARTTTLVLLAVIGLAVAAVVGGGWLIVADARRQVADARRKTDFVSNVSHELKTPLTSIRLFAELLRDGRVSDPTRAAEYLRIIGVEAERLTRLINNVLDFTRLERGRRRYQFRHLDLQEVAHAAWSAQEPRLREAGFTTAWQAGDRPLPVEGDPDALAQILLNLLSNAEKFAGDARVAEMHVWSEGGEACVSVLDRGLGVPPGDEQRIFERFYRAHDSLATGIPGTGIGLTLARRLAEDHRGRLLFEPRSGGGSRFTLRLPIRPSRPIPPTTDASPGSSLP